MGLFSNKIERSKVKPGDHIYSWRPAYIYAHHGIYMGEGKVIHFTRASGQEIGARTVAISSSPSLPVGNPSTTCGNQGRPDGVVCTCIDCFLSGGNLYIFKYGVSPAFFLAKSRGGTCTTASLDPPEQVLHRASYLLENGFGVYNLFKNNCEDFAIYCKTSLGVVGSVGRSGQVTSLYAASITNCCCCYFPLICMYNAIRLSRDVGMRCYVEKVDVESLLARSESIIPAI